MLEISILGYLGIRQTAEAGRPLAWPSTADRRSLH